MASKRTRSRSRSEIRSARRKRTLISLAVILIIAVSFPLWSPWAASFAADRIVEWSGRYSVKHVLVLGNRVVPESQILELAAVKSGSLLFTVPAGAVKSRVEKHPWIRHAYARRRLPDTVEIRVVEREPVAILRGDSLLMITADSVAVASLTPNFGWDLPILTPPRAPRLKPGAAVRDSATLNLLHEALVLRGVSPEAWHNLSELYYENGQMHAALAQPPVDVLLGRGASALAWSGALKLLTSTVRADLQNRTRLDLRVPGKIIVSDNPRTVEERMIG